MVKFRSPVPIDLVHHQVSGIVHATAMPLARRSWQEHNDGGHDDGGHDDGGNGHREA